MNEVAIVRFLADQTSISAPFIVHSGARESPVELTLFIMMDYIGYEMKMYDVLNVPRCPAERSSL